jgi:uncharacterized protein
MPHKAPVMLRFWPSGALACLVLALLIRLPLAAAAPDIPPLLRKMLDAAHAQVGVTVRYDPAYESIPFPGGDVPMERGVCTDVVVRAYRAAGIDLQLLLNEDMRKAFHLYPRNWGALKPDPNIDHRRVPNLAVFFTRHGQSLPVTQEPHGYKPGDIVAWKLPDGRPHIGIVSDRTTDGRPLIVHNIGQGAQVEDLLFGFTITGHYRYLPEKR